MNGSKLKVFFKMLILVNVLFCFLWISIVIADDDVYNFYFQKGAAPHSVIQGGAGQSSGAALLKQQPSAVPSVQPNADASMATVEPAPVDTQSQNIKRKRFVTTLGYLHAYTGNAKAYTLGLQYNFNEFIGAKLQGRVHEFKLYTKNEYQPGGMLAFVLTPLRVDLFGHRFFELSALAGAETEPVFKGRDDFAQSIEPMVGVSALLNINQNFGLELQASKSIHAARLGLSVALMF